MKNHEEIRRLPYGEIFAEMGYVTSVKGIGGNLNLLQSWVDIRRIDFFKRRRRMYSNFERNTPEEEEVLLKKFGTSYVPLEKYTPYVSWAISTPNKVEFDVYVQGSPTTTKTFRSALGHLLTVLLQSNYEISSYFNSDIEKIKADNLSF